MAMNHSKTWPVYTLAVVQLRVDPQGRPYSALIEHEEMPGHKQTETNEHHQITASATEKKSKTSKIPETKNGVVLPLSKKHLELFTKMSSTPALRNLRTDTVSTILEQDEFDSEHRSSLLNFNSCDLLAVSHPQKCEKFHVLALTRVDDALHGGIRRASEGAMGRRSNIKADNWDMIFSGTTGRKYRSKSCNNVEDTKTQGMKNNIPCGEGCNRHTECLLPDLPLDARKVTTLRRHYYPEGGWGWIIVVCSVMIHLLGNGLQFSSSQLVLPGADKFNANTVDFADDINSDAEMDEDIIPVIENKDVEVVESINDADVSDDSSFVFEIDREYLHFSDEEETL